MTFDFNFTLLLLIFMRMSGCIMFNSIFGRRNIPMIFKIGLTILLTMFAYNVTPDVTLEINSVLVLGVSLIKELLIGFMIGQIISMFLSVIILAGELIDMQMGISMSKIFDPASNVSLAVSASFINAMFMLLFFITNSHLTLVRIFVDSCSLIPYSGLVINPQIFYNLVSLFSLILMYSVKLALPILAVEMLSEIGVGILMKAVPQINVFMINIQLKLLIGLISIILLIPVFSDFLQNLTTVMFDNINIVLKALLVA